jgi:hypothetical protein
VSFTLKVRRKSDIEFQATVKHAAAEIAALRQVVNETEDDELRDDLPFCTDTTPLREGDALIWLFDAECFGITMVALEDIEEDLGFDAYTMDEPVFNLIRNGEVRLADSTPEAAAVKFMKALKAEGPLTFSPSPRSALATALAKVLTKAKALVKVATAKG